MPRLLLINDDEVWGRLLQRRLESQGVEACFHHGSAGALSAIRDGGYDVVLIDVRMRGLGGEQIIHALYHLRLPPRSKLVLCSAIPLDELRVRARELKVDGYISKADAIGGLERLVEDLIARDDQADARRAPEPSGPIACPLCQRTPAIEQPQSTVTTVLLVDDNVMNRDMLSRRLGRRGYLVKVAEDGVRAIEKAGESLPDIILMDMDLPVMNGLDATRALKRASHTSGIPVLALTAHSVLYERQNCLDAGADDCDEKPVNLTRLVEKMEMLLSRRRLAAC